MLRSPVVAGRFYAGTAEALASDVALCMKEGAAAAAKGVMPAPSAKLPFLKALKFLPSGSKCDLRRDKRLFFYGFGQ